MAFSSGTIRLQHLGEPLITARTEVNAELAASAAEYFDAFRCLHECYVRRGLIRKQAAQLRLTRHHLLPDTAVLLARRQGQILGTLSLVVNGPLGLPMHAVYWDEINALVASGARVAEATSL